MKPFDGPRLKIRHAGRHIEKARKEIEGFLSRRPYRLVIEADPDPAFQLVVLRQDEPVPNDIALIIGDAIHNLRSALDHTACELVRRNGQPEEGVKFPISKTAAEIGHCIRESKIRGAKKDVVDLIRALQPYPGGAGSAIAELHAIDIVDKHRLLVPIGQVMASNTFDPFPTFIRGDSTITFLPDHDDKLRLLKSGDTLWRINAIKQLTPGDGVRTSFDVAFATGTSFVGAPVAPLLRQLADYLGHVVEAFASLSVSGQHVSLPPSFLPRQEVAAILRIS